MDNYPINQKGFAHILLLVLVVVGVALYLLYSPKTKKVVENIIPLPTPYQFPYKNPAITKNDSYRIVVVGDSIVNSLGLNANVLREDLIKYYPDSEFVTYNYGYPSSNVLSLYERLTKITKNASTENQPILEKEFELIIIESF